MCIPHPSSPPLPQDCVQKTITRMESKFSGRVLAHVVFMLRSSDRVVQQRAAMALARMAPEADLRAIFVDKRGLDVLLDMLVDEALEQRMQVGSRWLRLCWGRW